MYEEIWYKLYFTLFYQITNKYVNVSDKTLYTYVLMHIHTYSKCVKMLTRNIQRHQPNITV